MANLKLDLYSGELERRLGLALAGDKQELEQFLLENSNLPGPRLNIALVAAFAEIIGQIVAQPEPPVDQLEQLLDSWAGLSLEEAPQNSPREILPAAAILSYGIVATVRPDWWNDEVAKLHKAASSPRWRTREMVAMALQKMLKADWARTTLVLEEWATEPENKAQEVWPKFLQ